MDPLFFLNSMLPTWARTLFKLHFLLKRFLYPLSWMNQEYSWSACFNMSLYRYALKRTIALTLRSYNPVNVPSLTPW